MNVGTTLNTPLHPTQLYDAGAELLILIYLLATERRGRPFPGRTFWMYMVLYGVSRFIIEFYRGDDRGMIFGISTSQVRLARHRAARVRHAHPASPKSRRVDGSRAAAKRSSPAAETQAGVSTCFWPNVCRTSRARRSSVSSPTAACTRVVTPRKRRSQSRRDLSSTSRFRRLVPATPVAEALPLSILFDDDDIVVVDKPAGMVVHPGAGHAGGTLVNALLHHVSGLSGIGGTARPGIVHRLDRGTSGVMVIAKHDRAHRDLTRQFHDREVGKITSRSSGAR